MYGINGKAQMGMRFNLPMIPVLFLKDLML